LGREGGRGGIASEDLVKIRRIKTLREKTKGMCGGKGGHRGRWAKTLQRKREKGTRTPIRRPMIERGRLPERKGWNIKGKRITVKRGNCFVSEGKLSEIC